MSGHGYFESLGGVRLVMEKRRTALHERGVCDTKINMYMSEISCPSMAVAACVRV